MRAGIKNTTAACAAGTVAVGVAGLLLTSIGAAAGASTQATISGTISPAVPNAPVRPRSVALSVVAGFRTTAPGSQPATVDKAVISFSHGATVNSRLFPSCRVGRLNRIGTKACPAGSRIGGGRTVAVGAGVVETLKVTAFNGPRGRSVLFYLHADAPVRINQAIQAPLIAIKSRFYAYQLTINVPRNLQVIAGVPVAVTQFLTTVKGAVVEHVRGQSIRRGYIEVPLCPPGALVPLRGVFSFVGAPTQTVDSGIACGEPPPA
jgi:hypothetical protein